MAWEIKVEMALAESPKALLVRLAETKEEVWVPKSQIDDDSEVYSMASGAFGGKLLVSDWWAAQRGLGPSDEDRDRDFDEEFPGD